MKKVLGILLLSLFAFTACNDDSSILEPSYDSTVQSLEKGRIIILPGRDSSSEDFPTDSTDDATDTTKDDNLNNDGE